MANKDYMEFAFSDEPREPAPPDLVVSLMGILPEGSRIGVGNEVYTMIGHWNDGGPAWRDTNGSDWQVGAITGEVAWVDGPSNWQEEDCDEDDSVESMGSHNPLTFREYMGVMRYTGGPVREHLSGLGGETWASPDELRAVLHNKNARVEQIAAVDKAEACWSSLKSRELSYRDHLKLAQSLRAARTSVIDAMLRLGTLCGVADPGYQDADRAMEMIAECLCGLDMRLYKTHRRDFDEFDPYMSSLADIAEMLRRSKA